MAESGDIQSTLHTHTTTDPSQHNISQPPTSYTYYHAGPLFTLAELHTNVLLSQAINSASSGRFIGILPQDLEQRDASPHSIRDEDLRALLSCDLALFTYDGVELDAGTVVEYMVAKMADIPTIILRTDFRGAGDQGKEGDSWNLMSSNWPRTIGITINAMVEYKAGLAKAMAEGKEVNAGEYMIKDVAARIVEGFEQVIKQPQRLPKELRESVFQWIALMPGFKAGSDQENIETLSKLCKDKSSKGLL
jgi:nucleoside 2-deoxyribosyltransferase